MKALGWLAGLAVAVALFACGCDNGGDSGGGSISVGAAVPAGSDKDKGLEVPDAATAAKFWEGTSPLVNVMIQCNSPKTGGDSSLAYYCPEIVAETGALKIKVNSDGTWTATAKDFVSPRSGLVYKFMGFTARTEANPLQTDNPLTIQPADQTMTFRGYWNTYEAN